MIPIIKTLDHKSRSLSVIPTTSTNTVTIHTNSHQALSPLTHATMLYVLPRQHPDSPSRQKKLTHHHSSRLFEKKPKSLRSSKAKKTPTSSRGTSRAPSAESSAASTPFSSRRPSISGSRRPSLAGSQRPSLSGSTRSNRPSLSESNNNFPGTNPLDDENNFTGASPIPAASPSCSNNFTGAAPKGSPRNNFLGVDRKLRNGFAGMNPRFARNNFPGDN